MIHVEENASGGAHGEAAEFEAWSLSCAVEYVGGTDCSSDASGGTVYPKVIDN